MKLFLGIATHSPHAGFFNAQHTFPSDPSFHLSARFNCSAVAFRLFLTVLF